MIKIAMCWEMGSSIPTYQMHIALNSTKLQVFALKSSQQMVKSRKSIATPREEPTLAKPQGISKKRPRSPLSKKVRTPIKPTQWLVKRELR